MFKYDFIPPEIQTVGIGKTLYLLGTSEDGPIYQPVRIKNKIHAAQIFGDRNVGTLIKAFEQAYDIDSTISIFLMRISGKSATLKVEGFHDDRIADILALRSLYGGAKYNSVVVTPEYRASSGEYLLKLSTPSGIIVYNMDNFSTMEHLVQQINRDCRSGVHRIQASTSFPQIPVFRLWGHLGGSRNLADGEDGVDISKDDLYIAVDTAYNLLLGTPIDIIVPCGMYFDDVHPTAMYGQATYGSGMYANSRDYLTLVDTYQDNKVVSYHEQLIDFCREQLKLGYMSHGVIGIRPIDVVPDNIETDNLYILNLVQATAFRDRTGLAEFKNGQWVDKGFYVSVFCSEVVVNPDTQQEYFDSGAVTYASLLTGHFDSTTNLKVPGNFRLRYELSEDELGQLSILGVSAYRDSVRHGLVVNNGVTAAYSDNELHDVANVRMIQITLSYINDAVSSVYDSEIDPGIRRQFLEDLIKDRLADLKTLGVLTGYDYSIDLTKNQGSGVLSLSLQTKYTVDGINTAAQISNTGG